MERFLWPIYHLAAAADRARTAISDALTWRNARWRTASSMALARIRSIPIMAINHRLRDPVQGPRFRSQLLSTINPGSPTERKDDARKNPWRTFRGGFLLQADCRYICARATSGYSTTRRIAPRRRQGGACEDSERLMPDLIGPIGRLLQAISARSSGSRSSARSTAPARPCRKNTLSLAGLPALDQYAPMAATGSCKPTGTIARL